MGLCLSVHGGGGGGSGGDGVVQVCLLSHVVASPYMATRHPMLPVQLTSCSVIRCHVHIPETSPVGGSSDVLAGAKCSKVEPCGPRPFPAIRGEECIKCRLGALLGSAAHLSLFPRDVQPRPRTEHPLNQSVSQPASQLASQPVHDEDAQAQAAQALTSTFPDARPRDGTAHPTWTQRRAPRRSRATTTTQLRQCPGRSRSATSPR